MCRSLPRTVFLRFSPSLHIFLSLPLYDLTVVLSKRLYASYAAIVVSSNDTRDAQRIQKN